LPARRKQLQLELHEGEIRRYLFGARNLPTPHTSAVGQFPIGIYRFSV
jgi:hypothetical protein